MNLEIEILKKYYETFKSNRYKYQKMEDYYHNKHDVLTTYTKINKRSNKKVVSNYIAKYIDSEVSYCLGKPVNYISKTGDKEIIDNIDYYLAHWSKSNDQNLLLQASIFGESYELYYLGKYGFSNIILNPLNTYVVMDDFGQVEILMRTYNRRFDETTYIDVYTSDYIYHLDENFKEIKEPDVNIFGEVPVSLCKINKTVYEKIKSLQDGYNDALSDQSNLLGDLRSKYLVFQNMKVDEEETTKINEDSILVLPPGADVKFLESNVNDTFIMNAIKTLLVDMYRQVGHLDSQEKPTSNTSGSQIRGRMLELEFRCSLLCASVEDTIKERLRFLFKYIKILKNEDFDVRTVSIKTTPNVPFDLTMLGQFISQIGDNLSLETKISQLPFIESPLIEVSKIKAEREDEINLDNIPSNDGAEE